MTTPDKYPPCPNCDGKGGWTDNELFGPWTVCYVCNGMGHLINDDIEDEEKS
jgi:DnaJ-class molecular chaperone